MNLPEPKDPRESREYDEDMWWLQQDLERQQQEDDDANQ